MKDGRVDIFLLTMLALQLMVTHDSLLPEQWHLLRIFSEQGGHNSGSWNWANQIER